MKYNLSMEGPSLCVFRRVGQAPFYSGTEEQPQQHRDTASSNKIELYYYHIFVIEQLTTKRGE